MIGHRLDWLLILLVAAPWAAGLVLLFVKRALGIVLLQASGALYGLVLLYPAFLSIFFFDGSLRSLWMLLALAGCILVLAVTSALRRAAVSSSSSSGSALAAASAVPLLFMGTAYGLVQLWGWQADRKVLARMDLKTGDEAKRLIDCLARFSAANAQRYPADAAALQQHCGNELRLSYYQVEYLTAAGAVDYSMCLQPISGASPEPNPVPWILGPSGITASRNHPAAACGFTSIVGGHGVAATAHQCLLRRQMRADITTVPNFRDITLYGDGCLRFDFDGVKVTDVQLTTPEGRLLLLPASSPERAWQPHFLYCHQRAGNPPELWSSRTGPEPAPPEFAKLCDT